MKCLRVSMYPPMATEPITVVMRDIDMKVGPDYFEAENMAEGDGAFIITDVFECEDGLEITDATLIALNRQNDAVEAERNMALLYYWDAAKFPMLASGGLITTTEPSPLTREQIEYTLLRLSDHPAYDGYTITCHDEDFNPVTLRDGKIV